MDSDKDKELECHRYDNRAEYSVSEKYGISGSHSVPQVLQSAYIYYESQIKENIPFSGSHALEIGAGMGAFTETLLKMGALTFATDISDNSLKVIVKKFGGYETLQTKVADMESLPFNNDSFDVVTSAGSLSYGDNALVLTEIYRVLKDDGIFICVDSLNHNPVYRLNRWLHYLRGNRTLSTLKRIPTQLLIDKYEEKFGSVNIRYFGGFTWMIPLLMLIFNEKNIADIIDRLDILIGVKKSAFKFVMIVKKVN